MTLAGDGTHVLEKGSPLVQVIPFQLLEIEATDMAKKMGIQVRYYMMLGNRGETAKTFQETLDFLKAARPHQYLFSCLSIYPGTLDFHDAEKAGWLAALLFIPLVTVLVYLIARGDGIGERRLARHGTPPPPPPPAAVA